MEPTPISSQALPAGTRIEEFVIERVLGSGGFGITYLARDARLNRRVVIKENLPVQFCFRDPGSLSVAPRHTTGEDLENFRWSLENFSKESAMLAALDHVGIVKVLRSFEAFGTAYFVMPFVEGVTLDELHKERRDAGEGFSEDELRVMLERLLDGLAHLHDRGIYHRDIKPGNILITSEGVPVLIDFGSARQRLSERSMTVVESAGYTPFEQLQSRGNVGPWSDLYALAATLVKVMTGEAPPKANDRTMGDPWQPLTGRAELRGTYTAGFLGGLDKALRLQVEERWQDAREWQRGLVSGVVGVKTRGKRPATIRGEKAGAEEPPYGSRWSLVAVVLLAMVAAGAWWLMREGSQAMPAVFAATSPGGLVITSEPSGVELTSGTREVLGRTPVELTGLAAGQPWQGTLTMQGYVPAEVKADVVSGETKLVAPVKLKRQAQKVIVSSEPSGAEVVEDGKVVGSTPWESNPREVGDGVALTLRKPGHDDIGLSGEVLFGKTLILQGTLKTTPQQVVVTSEPAGADVWKDGILAGTTPYVWENGIPGISGSYVLKKEGYEDGNVEGTVEIGKPLDLKVVLKRLKFISASSPIAFAGRILYPWKTHVACTIFWIGEQPSARNPTPNSKSCWDRNWATKFGGYDDPDPVNRVSNHSTGEFRPKNFVPKLNQFYVALPYNDVLGNGQHKTEAARVIPWFLRINPKPGETVCKGRWIQIYNGSRSCYGQWEDCGPWETDDWEFVFGKKSPKTKHEGGAGISVSPSIRDYLGLRSGQKVHWRFAEAGQVPYGPWKKYGDDLPVANDPNQLAQQRYLEYLRKLRDEESQKKTLESLQE